MRHEAAGAFREIVGAADQNAARDLRQIGGHASDRSGDRDGPDRLRVGPENGAGKGMHIRLKTADRLGIPILTNSLEQGADIYGVGHGFRSMGGQIAGKDAFDKVRIGKGKRGEAGGGAVKGQNASVFHRDAASVTGAVMMGEGMQAVATDDRDMRGFSGRIAELLQKFTRNSEQRHGGLAERRKPEKFRTKPVEGAVAGLFDEAFVLQLGQEPVDRCLVDTGEARHFRQPDFKSRVVEMPKQGECFGDGAQLVCLNDLRGLWRRA